MLKFKEIALKEHYASIERGMKPSYTCAVMLQHGDHSYDTIKLDLSPEDVREVIAFAISKAMARLTFDFETIDVEGKPGVPREEEPALAPDFAAEPMVIKASTEEPL